ncbi:ATPase, partial [Desulfobacteraceae bacterium SEEP-SAG9]
MERYLIKFILDDLKKKIVLLTGPRQSGKTTLSKMLSSNFDYFNFDNPEHRLGLIERSWDRSKELIIFDELHKLKNWKSWLKGIYDTEGVPPWIIVTGSAKLETYRKVGDSLAGRFFQFRLHPLDLKEINQILQPANLQAVMDQLLDVGGFPEPYLEGNARFYNRWKRSHLDIILKQDLLDLENVQQVTSVETLIQLLRKRVGSPISYSNLAQDLQCSDKTVKRWLTILENMYIIFKVRPFHSNIARSILKAPKYYFYDTGQVIGDVETKLENLTACAFLKEIHYLEDCYGDQLRLYYLMTKDGKEIDFFITRNEKPLLMAEVKWAESNPSRNFQIFDKYFPQAKKIQITGRLDR